MKNEITVSVPDSPFRWGLLLMMVKSLTSFSVLIPYGDGLDDLLSLAAAGCFSLSMLPKEYSLKRLGIYAAVLVLTGFSASRTGTLSLFLTVLTCLALYREELEQTVSFLLFWEGLYLLLHGAFAVLLACLGENMTTEVNHVLRFNFGFSHPNVFSILIINLLSMWVWLRFDSLRPVHYVAAAAVTLVCFWLTDTRSVLCAVAVLLVLLAVRRWDKLLRFGAAVCLPIGAVVEYCLWSGFTGGSSWAAWLDGLLSGRIRLGSYALEHFGLTLLGQSIDYGSVAWDEFWRLNVLAFDDIYSYLAVVHGVIWLIILAVLFFRAAWKGTARTAIFLILWALYGAAEMHGVNPYMFFPILLAAAPEERHE